MINSFIFLGFSLTALLGGSWSPSKDSDKQQYSTVSDAVVKIYTDKGSYGSGSIISADGWVLTAGHVVDMFTNEPIKLSLPDGRIFKATFIKRSPTNDIALIKIQNATNLPFIHIAKKAPKSGDNMSLWGYAGGPLALKLFKYYDHNPGSTHDMFFGPGIDHGDSGGPILNDKEEQVGVGTAKTYTSLGVYVGNILAPQKDEPSMKDYSDQLTVYGGA